MHVYYGVLIILGLLALVGGYEYEQQTTRKMANFFSISMLILVAGLRYRVGTDYGTYYVGYNAYKQAQLTLLNEPGLKIIARFSSVLIDRPETMFFIASVITVGLMTITIVRNSDDDGLSLLLYVLMCVWHGSFNGVRQYLAAAVLFAGHYFIKEKKFANWCGVVAIACMFHITAIIAILFYYWGNLKISWKQVWLSLGIIAVGLTVYDRIFSTIGFLKGDELNTELAYIQNGISPLRIAVAWTPVLFFIVFRNRYYEEDERESFYFNMSLLHAVLMTVAINSTYLGRVGIYTGVYNTITWPMLLERCNTGTRRMLTLLMVVFYFIYWRTEASNQWLSTFRWVFSGGVI